MYFDLLYSLKMLLKFRLHFPHFVEVLCNEIGYSIRWKTVAGIFTWPNSTFESGPG